MSGASDSPTPGQKGDATEAVVQAELIRKGYTILVPWGNQSPYDLVIESDGFHRIQVKTARIRDDETIQFRTSTSYADGNKHRRGFYTEDDVDYFITWCPELDSFYCIPIGDAPKYAMTLRVSDREIQPANRACVNWADYYALDHYF